MTAAIHEDNGSLLAAPPGFPSPARATRYRQLLDDIVTGAGHPPPCVPRFALPRPSAWSYGLLRGAASPTQVETWAPGVVFGGYIGCLVDQFAGLVMLSVLPDGAAFLTASIHIDLHTPIRPGEAGITARVLALAAREATVAVELDQDGRITSRATVTQVLRNTARNTPAGTARNTPAGTARNTPASSARNTPASSARNTPASTARNTADRRAT
jgi:acyl-coenzyme A thioesterase PaaI-like protein